MNFQLTKEQLLLKGAAHEFARKEIVPIAARYDENEEFPHEIIPKLAASDYLTMAIPQEYGGPGLDSMSIAVILEELGWGCAGIATIAGANSLATYPILIGGSEEQKKRFLPPLNQGRLAAFCLTEPEAGSDAAAISTTAERDGERFILNGKKCFITNGGVADLYTVFATTDPKKGVRSLSAFLVPRDTPGLIQGKKEKKMGIRSSETSEVIFQDVLVPEENLLGREGKGFRIAMETLDIARPSIGALAVGLARSAYEKARGYAKERIQFGKSIAQFQAIQFMLADMATDIDAARLLVYRAAAMKEEGVRFSKEAAMAKVFAGDMAMRVTTDAVQIMGGYGYIREYPLEKYMRDAKIMQIYEGTNQIQRLVIGNAILK